jgi:hypothetical protein
MSLTVPQTARLEIKFTAYETEYHRLVHWLNLHSAAFYVPFPSRWVNSIYFDTYDYSAFVGNLSGESSRTKVRYRWYGNADTPDSGTLEVKRKRNYFGWKLRYPVSEPPYAEGDTWQAIYDKILAQLPPAGRVWLLQNPVPVMRNRYFRDYFLSRDGLVRVTIDTQQAVWDQRFKPKPNLTRRANLPRSLVVEFKFDRENCDVASQLVQGMPIRVSRHSKYINAVRAIAQI